MAKCKIYVLRKRTKKEGENRKKERGNKVVLRPCAGFSSVQSLFV